MCSIFVYSYISAWYGNSKKKWIAEPCSIGVQRKQCTDGGLLQGGAPRTTCCHLQTGLWSWASERALCKEDTAGLVYRAANAVKSMVQHVDQARKRELAETDWLLPSWW